MDKIQLLLLAIRRQVGDRGGRTLLTQQLGGQACGGGDVARRLIVDSGDEAADLHPGLCGGRVVIQADDAGVAGGCVIDDSDADAGQCALLHRLLLAVFLGGVVDGVLVVDAVHVARSQAVIQGVLVDGEILPCADKTINFGQLVVLALLVFDAGHCGVEHLHGHDHGQREGDGHCNDGNGGRHAKTDFFAHGSDGSLLCLRYAP